MSASIQGKVASLDIASGYAVIAVGGLGYKVFVPHNTLTRLDHETVFLHTYLVVREDSLTLFGRGCLQ